MTFESLYRNQLTKPHNNFTRVLQIRKLRDTEVSNFRSHRRVKAGCEHRQAGFRDTVQHILL